MAESYLKRRLIVSSVVSATLMLGVRAFGATVVFSDNFSGSTINQALTSSNVTSTSSSYDAASNKAASASIASGDLKLAFSSSSGYAEYQTLFTQSPVTLSNAGGGAPTQIEATVTFTDTSGAVLNANGSYTMLGLYNSNGNVSASPTSVVPYTNLQSSGLSATTTEATGGVQNWVGYNGSISGVGGNANNEWVRGAQTGATQQINQDLVIGGVGSAAAETSLGGTNAATFSATTGHQYTQDLLLTLNPSGSLTVVSTLYDGVGTGGTVDATTTGTVASSPNVAFDGLGFGMRGATQQIDYNSVSITDNAVVSPEPASLGLIGLMGTGLLRRRRN